MNEWIIVGWVIFVIVLALNASSAGVAALLHCWPGRFGRGGRIVLAGLVAGSLPASIMIVVPLAQGGAGGQTAYWILASGLVFAVAVGLSLPGAIVVTRRLARPGEDYRAFE